eukprot:gene5715-6902_t
MAEGDEPLARRTIAQGITLAVILGFSATAGLNTFAEPLLSLMVRASPTGHGPALSYGTLGGMFGDYCNFVVDHVYRVAMVSIPVCVVVDQDEQPINGLVFVLDGILLGASDFAFIAQGMVVSSALASGAMLTLGSNGLEGVWQSLAVLQICIQIFFFLSFTVDSLAVAAEGLVADALGIYARQEWTPASCMSGPLFSECVERDLYAVGIATLGDVGNAGELGDVGIAGEPGLLDTRTLLSAALGCNLANLVLDPVLIFGAGPIPAFGVGGAAAATALAEWGTAIVLLWQLRGKGMLVPLPGLPTWSEVAPLVQAGGALLVRTVSLQTVLLLGTATALAAPVSAHRHSSALLVL